MFSKKYTVYKIHVDPLNSEVERRFSDFLWLHDALQRDHPGVLVPPMARKKRHHNKFDPSVISGRLETMQEFLCSLVDNPELLANPALVSFLIDTDANFAKTKKNVDKIAYSNSNSQLMGASISKKNFTGKNAVKVEHLTTESGNVESIISPSLKNFSQALKAVVKDVTPLLQKCKEYSKQLSDSINSAGAASDKLGEATKSI